MNLLGIDDKLELYSSSYILINSDGMKLPVSQEMDRDMTSKFLVGPIKVTNEDELFELFD